jgi:maltooligosyltrehalose trehalohydrolase
MSATSVAAKAVRDSTIRRRLPIGAEIVNGGVHFRLWAPKCQKVHVVFEDGLPPLELEAEAGGFFSGLASNAGDGTLYRFRLDDQSETYPDPASRFQPQGVHGPSQAIDPRKYQWKTSNWQGRGAHGQVVYEMHIGSFTPEGTFAAAIDKLKALAEVGITCLEVMPVADFAGEFGWGYDGVDMFAPTRLYGKPDDFRAFVDAAHSLGLSVILDAVYNHFGPDGNYLKQFSDTYFSEKHKTDWGDAINFDGEGSQGVREFFVSNARYWIEEFQLDGFRFDATHAIVDDSPEHILKAISIAARQAAGDKQIYLVNENEPQHTRIVRPIEKGGYGMDALWNDDFHHSAVVALTGRSEAYYSDHGGKPQEFISAAKWGYLFQGQRYSWQKKRRGSPALDLPPTAFVHFIENHDQIANSARGLRIYQQASLSEFKAMTAFLLLMPQTPMLFQGQEFAASSTFHYFADHHPELAKLVSVGRAKELLQFRSVAAPEMQACLLDPADRAVFDRCKLKWDELRQGSHQQIFEFHKELLCLRRTDPVFSRVQCRGDIDGAVLGPGAWVLRYLGKDGDDRLVLVNMHSDLKLFSAPEPLLAPPLYHQWTVQFQSEDPRFGGIGAAPPETEEEGWLLPGRCTVVLKSVAVEKEIEPPQKPQPDKNA